MKLPLTPLNLLARARRLFADRLAVVQGDDVRMTYGDFAARCDGLAALLRDEVRIAPGDRVAFLAGNVHQLLEAYYGVLLAGGVLLPLNVRCSPAELTAVLDDAEAAVLFADPALPAPAFGGPTFGLDAWGPAASPVEAPEVDEDAPAELFYTSGSTGVPKGALLSHRALYLHAVHNALTNGISGHDVLLHTIPLFHVNGWGTPHFLTGLGGTHVMLPRFDAAEVLRLVERERVTRLFLVPTMARLLLDCPDLRDGRRDVSSVVQVSIGGAPSTPELLAEVEVAFGCEAICGYGMTESSPTLTRSLDKPGAAPSRAKRATTGLPIVGVDLRVLDDDDREVPWDGATVGEVCARSNHVMIGYWRRPEETAEALRGGWLRTGDLAVVDPDGYVTIVDRRKDLIVSGGENIASPEVERALLAHPAVREAAVVGMPDERWGEVPAAFVTFHDGAPSPTEDELVAWVQGRLARFKAPKRVVVLDALPTGGTGKVSKPALRALLDTQPVRPRKIRRR